MRVILFVRRTYIQKIVATCLTKITRFTSLSVQPRTRLGDWGHSPDGCLQDVRCVCIYFIILIMQASGRGANELALGACRSFAAVPRREYHERVVLVVSAAVAVEEEVVEEDVYNKR